MDKKKVIGFRAVEDALARDSAIEKIRVHATLKQSKRFLAIKNSAEAKGIAIDYLHDPKFINSQIEALITVKNENISFREHAYRLSSLSTATVVILDNVQDTGNFGSIIRTAEAFGVQMIIIPSRNSVQVTDKVIEVSAGAYENIEIVTVSNITNAIRELKAVGFWIYGADVGGAVNFKTERYPAKSCLVMGNENSGLRDNVKNNCDILIKIPLRGKSNSLNVAIATGVILSEMTAGLKSNVEIDVKV